MLNKLKSLINKNTEIFALIILVFITIISTSYYNYNKQKILYNFKTTLNNIYFKKTVHHIFNSLEPKFKKIEHNISVGETFDNILEKYSISKKEIIEIKEKLSKEVNLNKLNPKQKILFTIDQSQNLLKEFIFQISNTKKIYLTKNTQFDGFNQRILVTKLNKDILYKENIILQSLYKSAIDESIPPNIIIEFARIYGFQIDFQRDIQKKDSFQIMYEVFIDDKKKLLKQEIFSMQISN